jgi:hypothetical protein
MNTVWRVRLMLGWIASQLHWIAHTDTESIYVDEITYRRCLKEYLASQGIEWQTWTQYMQPAEEAWKRQCEAENRLQANFDFWRSVPGVRVVPRRKEAQTASTTW